MPDVLVDSSFLVALGYPRDRNHIKAKTFAAEQVANLLIPDVVLVEALYNLRRLGGLNSTIRFAKILASQQPTFISLTVSDFTRAIELMDIYSEAALDFVDCCLTALAEHFNLNSICTFDHRDFSMIRPRHIDYFSLLLENQKVSKRMPDMESNW